MAAWLRSRAAAEAKPRRPPPIRAPRARPSATRRRAGGGRGSGAVGAERGPFDTVPLLHRHGLVVSTILKGLSVLGAAVAVTSGVRGRTRKNETCRNSQHVRARAACRGSSSYRPIAAPWRRSAIGGVLLSGQRGAFYEDSSIWFHFPPGSPPRGPMSNVSSVNPQATNRKVKY